MKVKPIYLYVLIAVLAITVFIQQLLLNAQRFALNLYEYPIKFF